LHQCGHQALTARQALGGLPRRVTVLSTYLLENYLFQVSPFLIGSADAEAHNGLPDDLTKLSFYIDGTISLRDLVDVTNFPAEALSFYSVHLVPEAEAGDGYQKMPFEMIMDGLRQAFPFGYCKDVPGRTAARVMTKTQLDLTDFRGRFDVDRTLASYQDPDRGPYLVRLHLQLLIDAIYFVLAHELAHIALGHMGHGEATALREEEAKADAAALSMLSRVPGFQPRSLIVVFCICRDNEPAIPPDRMDHPLARNRLSVLAQALIAEGEGEALRADVNAGLALLPTRFEPQPLLIGWPDGVSEEIIINTCSYGDMDLVAHVMVYINRQPRSVTPNEGFAEHAALLSHLAYRIAFEVRDRIDPGKVFTWGGAGYHPTVRYKDLYFYQRATTLFTRLSFRIPAPPEFILLWPDAELAIKEIKIIYREPDLISREQGDNQVRFFYDPPKIELRAFLVDDLDLARFSPSPQGKMLLAARRYRDYARYDQCLEIYDWMFSHNPGRLHYTDLTALVGLWIDADRYDKAAEVARWAVGPGRVQRPGFHIALAHYHAERNEAQDAFEEAFLEMCLFGSYGLMFDEAKDLCEKVLSWPNDAMLVALRTSVAHGNAAKLALQEHKREHVAVEFRAAIESLRAAQSCAQRDFVCLRQLLSEYTLGIARLEDGEINAAAEAARAVLVLQPDFVPALVDLASVALLQGEPEAAYSFWRQALAIAPFHDIVVDRREENRDGLHQQDERISDLTGEATCVSANPDR